jgi:hypothetical protein
MRWEVLEQLEEDWEPLSRAVLVAWLVFYLLFLLHAIKDDDGFLLIDNVNLIVHEAGHLLFSWLGSTLGLWGGTLLQFLVPLALAGYFVLQRKLAGAAFAVFFFFENFLYTATYMADARRQELPLVSVGGEEADHDWFEIFSSLGLLQHDETIAGLVRVLGWLGMLATVGWLGWRGRESLEISG